MRAWSKRSMPDPSRVFFAAALKDLSKRPAFLLPAIVLALLNPAVLAANDAASSATSQSSREAANEQLSPPNLLTGPDSRKLMEILHRGIVRCGGPLTAVLRLHVMHEGVIDSFVLQKSSGNACFDQMVLTNAEAAARARLRVTPAMRNEVAESGWAPVAIAARD